MSASRDGSANMTGAWRIAVAGLIALAAAIGIGRFAYTPLLPMMHPSYLLQSPGAKREAWADLLSLKARLK